MNIKRIIVVTFKDDSAPQVFFYTELEAAELSFDCFVGKTITMYDVTAGHENNREARVIKTRTSIY